MFARLKISKTIIWVLNLLIIFLCIFSIYRFITFMIYKPKHTAGSEILKSFFMGIRYDLRWIAFMLLPIIVISINHRWSPFFSSRNKKWWSWYLAVITFIVFVFFAAGFGSYSYNRTPLDAGAMNFAEDFRISWRMMRQTYPMFWMLTGLGIAVLFFRWMYHKSHWQVVNRTDGLGIPYRRKHFFGATLFLLLLAWGSFSTQPLCRKDCFTFSDSFLSYLSLNPMQNFFSTIRLRKPDYSTQKARQVFPLVAEWMQLPDRNSFSYRRQVGPRSTSFESRPNIVLVQCESFSMYKSSMSGNPLNATPFFDSMSRQGIFFNRCFTPHFSTARALFAILTGIPDAQLFKFSSRNPDAQHQYTIINELADYEKHYFLGGDPQFGNFEGLLHNINGLQMHTGKRPGIPEINVWGISDKNLFLEANTVFSQARKPFFAYIQTAGNHRPFDKSMAESDTDFIRLKPPAEDLRKCGFESPDEYNSFRYSDYSIQKFMEAAQNEKYFSNTIFVFVGDHGVAGNAGLLYPRVWSEQRLTDVHVPLLFYAPQLLPPQYRTEVVSQIDVLPTIAGMLHQSYTNTALGRDLLDPVKKFNFAFVTNTADHIGMVTDDYYFTKNINSGEANLYPMKDDHLFLPQVQRDSVQHQLAGFTDAFYETAKYLIMNNKRN